MDSVKRYSKCKQFEQTETQLLYIIKLLNRIQLINLNKNIDIIMLSEFNRTVYMNGGCKIIVI